MAWLSDSFGDGFTTLKGQITKFTKEVLPDDPLGATSFEGRIKDLEKQCAEQLNELEALRSENKRIKESNSTELNENQIQQICEFENKLAELTAEKNELTIALDKIEEEHEKELEIVIKDRDELRAKLNNQEEEKELLARTQEENNKLLEIKDLEIQKLRNTSQEPSEQLKQLIDENEELKIKLQNALESSSQIQNLQNENEKLEEKLNDILALKEKLEFKEVTFKQKLENAEEMVKKLSDENLLLTNASEIAAQEYSKLEDKLKSMESLVQRTEERENLVSSGIVSEIRILKTLVSRIRGEFLPSADQQTENTEEHSQTDDVKRLLQDVSQMTEIIKTISQGLSTISQEKNRLEKEVEVLKTLSAKTEQELLMNVKAKQQLEGNILEWAAAVTNRDEVIKNLTIEKSVLENEITSVKTSNTTLSETNQQLESKCKEYEKKIETLDAKIKESENAAQEWKKRLDALQIIYETDTKRAEKLNQNKEEQLKTYQTENGEQPTDVHYDQMTRLLNENADLKTLVQQLRENIFTMNTRDVNQNPQQHRRSHSQTDDPSTDARYQALISENKSLVEKESNLRRELERLRAHLVEVEEHYTEQAMTSESELTECRSKLAILEDQLRNTSNVYKSANVRSSQQVEALQAQISLMDVQRKDLQIKQSEAEDNAQKQAAALASLQLVLEQFQLDKKREIQVLLDRHAYQIELERRLVKETQAELENVRQQLTDAKNGLKAGMRLGEQLEKKSGLVEELQQELQKSRQELAVAEKKLENISQSTAAKIDKSIIKNLMVGYLTAQGDHKNQALKILSSVLELSQEERTRVGIDGQSGWLSHLLSPVSGSANQGESLSQAFVRFLETESRPLPTLKLLPEPIGTTPTKRTPLVLSDLVLPSVTQTAVSETGLNDVLNTS